MLGRLFLRFAEEKKEQKAQTRYEEKLDYIDDAVDKHHRVGVCDSKEDEQRGGTSGTPAVPKCGKGSPSVDEGGTKKGGRVRVPARKKVTKKAKRKSATPRKKRSGKKKPVQKPKS